MREWEQLGQSQPDPMVVLHRAVSLSTRLLGSLNEEDIYETVKEEFSHSMGYRLTVLLLEQGAAKLRVATTSTPQGRWRAAETATGLSLGQHAIDLNRSGSLRRVITQSATLRLDVNDVIYELSPFPQAHVISGILRTDNRVAVLTPLSKYAETIGVLGISASDPPEDMADLVRSLGRNISFALELADERARRSQLEKESQEHERLLERLVWQRSTELREANAKLEQEIAERRRAEDALGNSVGLWQATFDAISDPVCMLDLEGKIQRCNLAMANRLGKEFGEILGQPFDELVFGSPEPPEGYPLARVRETRRSQTSLVPMGDEWFSVTVDPWLDESGNLLGALHIMSDVTDTMRLEERLREAQKLEAVGRLAGGVAHHFRNLLTPIIGVSDLILRDLSADDPLRADIGQIRKSGLRAAALTGQMLAFSREQDIRLMEFDLKRLV